MFGEERERKGGLVTSVMVEWERSIEAGRDSEASYFWYVGYSDARGDEEAVPVVSNGGIPSIRGYVLDG
jgi:hypothetical protein